MTLHVFCQSTKAATGVCAMSRYVAPLGFTLAATWVATIFMLLAR